MDMKSGVRVSVEMHEGDGEEGVQALPEADDGFDAGFAQGWCQAACNALENMYDRYRDLGWAKELLYPGLDEEAPGMAALIDELMEDYVKEMAELDAAGGVSAYEETPYRLGRRGEDAACRYLRSKGYSIIRRNWGCPFGEADIIAQDADGTVCFIEVKTRRGERDAVPEEAVTPEKRYKYENIALSFMSGEGADLDAFVRFDAIGIVVDGANHALLRHHMGYLNGLA